MSRIPGADAADATDATDAADATEPEFDSRTP
jgi:hypothetical protein